MKRCIVILCMIVLTNPLFSQARQFEVSYHFGFLSEKTCASPFGSTTVLNPEIRVGYELFNNCMVSLNYGYWDNNIEGVLNCQYSHRYNYSDNYLGLLFHMKDSRSFRFVPYIGFSIHSLKTCYVEQHNSETFLFQVKRKPYGCFDFGLRFAFNINRSLAFHIEAQGSKFFNHKDNIFMGLFKTGVSVSR